MPDEFQALVERARGVSEETRVLDPGGRGLGHDVAAIWNCIAHIADTLWPPPEPEPLADLAALREEIDVLKKENGL